ncbi:MAG: hypothetical protein AMXMBFR78_27110 [Rubrivivax sp.]|jgi:iron complex transport system substrate-binding protein|nr:ABC transporter substrate-binding protein [Rubrivivax sp.]
MLRGHHALNRRAWLTRAAACLAAPGALAAANVPALARASQQAAAAAAGGSLIQVFGKASTAPARLFAAGPPAGVLLACLAPERLLGWPMSLSDDARAWLPPAARDKPLLGRLSGRGSTVSLETLLSLKPDLILDAGTVDATHASTARRVAEQTGLPYALVDGRLADSPAQLRQVGRLLGLDSRCETLAAFAEDALAAAARPTTGDGRRPSVYLARAADGLETAGAGSINAEIIEAAGGRNAALTGRPGVARVSMEQLLAWAPDWVLTQDRNFHRLAQTDALWRTLPALREGRLLLAPALPFGWLDGPPSVNRLPGVKWLAARLRDGQDTGPGARAQELDDALRFYRLFYGVTPARATMRDWLDGRA